MTFSNTTTSGSPTLTWTKNDTGTTTTTLTNLAAYSAQYLNVSTIGSDNYVVVASNYASGNQKLYVSATKLSYAALYQHKISFVINSNTICFYIINDRSTNYQTLKYAVAYCGPITLSYATSTAMYLLCLSTGTLTNTALSMLTFSASQFMAYVQHDYSGYSDTVTNLTTVV